MEKIIVISDSHKNVNYIKKVINLEKDFSRIFHLGDNYSDMDLLTISYPIEIVRVPGLFDPEYSSSKTDNVIQTTIRNWTFTLSHDIKDALKINLDTDFYLYGHTHQWNLEKRWERYFLNPGHIKRHYDRGNDASYCLMQIDEESIDINFKKLDGKIYFSKTINNRRNNDN